MKKFVKKVDMYMPLVKYSQGFTILVAPLHWPQTLNRILSEQGHSEFKMQNLYTTSEQKCSQITKHS
jgi:hypothetical protein